MALNWGKGFSFAGLTKRAGKVQDGIPTKTYINLLPESEDAFDTSRTVMLGVLLAAAVAIFGKFGVYDFYARVAAKNAEATEKASTLTKLESQLTDYDRIQEEYNLYEAARMVTDANAVAAMDALGLVDRIVAPAAHVDKVELNGNVLRLTLTDASLDGAGGIVNALYQQSIVKGVTVTTAEASNDSSSTPSVTMSIALQTVDDDGVTGLLEKTDAQSQDASATTGA